MVGSWTLQQSPFGSGQFWVNLDKQKNDEKDSQDENEENPLDFETKSNKPHSSFLPIIIEGILGNWCHKRSFPH